MRTLSCTLAALLSSAGVVEAQGFGVDAEVWKFVRESYDRDGDGEVSPEEYGRGEEKFARFDRDGDGALTADDFRPGARRSGGSRRSPRRPSERRSRGGMLPILAVEFGKAADTDHDGEVPRKEWNAWADTLRFDEDGRLVLESLSFARGADRTMRMIGGRLGRMEREGVDAVFADLDEDGDGTLQRGELGELPIVGDVAPTFSLPLADDPEKEFDLASRKGEKPVALIFGSYT